MAIVVGYAATDEGRAALGRAADEARTRGVRLLVVNSTRPDHVGRRTSPEDVARVDDDLRRVSEDLTRSGVEHDLRQPSPTPDPAEDIISAAVESGAELIVIGLRRRTPVGKLLLGSNAQRILLDAPCPVLAVRASA